MSSGEVGNEKIGSCSGCAEELGVDAGLPVAPVEVMIDAGTDLISNAGLLDAQQALFRDADCLYAKDD